MASFRTHYDNLKIDRSAPPILVKAAYKALSFEYHPDRNSGNSDAERRFKLIQKAYEVLSDPVSRREHDDWIAKQEEAVPKKEQRTKARLNLRPLRYLFNPYFLFCLFAIGATYLMWEWSRTGAIDDFLDQYLDRRIDTDSSASDSIVAESNEIVTATSVNEQEPEVNSEEIIPPEVIETEQIINDVTAAETSENLFADALLDFYEKANGDNWTNNDGWGVGDYCLWYGITCDFDGISIFLSGNNLTGTVSQDLGFMERLKRLDLSRNELEGQIPDSLGRLEQLQYLDLSQNKLSGPIPDAIGSITELRHFDIQHNDQISGEFPKSICELSNIQVLKLGNTTLTGQSNLSGEIPACITNLKSLTHLDISSTKLSGEIPLEMGNLVELHTLEMYGNEGLVGSIPQSFGKLRNLRMLYLSNNNLSGNIPTALGNLENLKRIGLEENALTGSVPASFENFSGLELLSLRNNALTGKMPSFPFRWETPLGLFLGGNKFDVVDSLENLNREYEEGLLTDEEFQEAKRQLLL